MAPPWSPQYRSPKPPLQVRFIFCENYHFNLIVSGTCIILLSPSIYLTAPFLSAHIMSGHHFAPLLFPPTELCFSPFINSYTIALLLKYHAHKHTSRLINPQRFPHTNIQLPLRPGSLRPVRTPAASTLDELLWSC